jgi:hypothetical protein
VPNTISTEPFLSLFHVLVFELLVLAKTWGKSDPPPEDSHGHAPEKLENFS